MLLGASGLSENYAKQIPCRGARLARRDEGANWGFVTPLR